MQPHQQRVVNEKSDLDVKVKALSDFIQLSPFYTGLQQDEKDRLLEQHDIMNKYSDVLGRRIEAFTE